ncbi:MAG: epoxyqueuosine reductase QueH [Oscillospiraceae bacterium]|nr:epoxyqueuosine reductase QueH [Oscillospiraceae bacterium]
MNYQKRLEEIIEALDGRKKLLLHACCAPCSSYVLEYLTKYFDISILYYNPNISPYTEYEKRISELKRLVREMPLSGESDIIDGKYDPERFSDMANGMEDMPEGGERCFKCYRLRMEEAAKAALERGFDYFTTTLSISPHKNAQKINEIGRELEQEYGVKYLFADFKKKDGHKRSIQISHEYGLYRQSYCGCIYSKAAAEKQKNL